MFLRPVPVLWPFGVHVVPDRWTPGPWLPFSSAALCTRGARFTTTQRVAARVVTPEVHQDWRVGSRLVVGGLQSSHMRPGKANEIGGAHGWRSEADPLTD